MTFWYGNDLNYADSRIRNTVIRGRGEAFFVDRLLHPEVPHGKYFAKGFRLGSYDPIRIPFDELDLSPFRLGYVNKLGRAVYIVKVPQRQDWRQGIRMEQLRTLSGISIRYLGLGDLKHMLSNNYPTLEEAQELLKVGKEKGYTKCGCAWHYDWALLEDGLIQYRGTKIVGQLSQGRVLLEDKYKYLRESLEAIR